MPVIDRNAVIWIGVILFCLTYCKYVLKYSFKDIMKDMFEEFRKLLSGKISPESINAGVIIGLIILAFIFIFLSTGAKVVNGAASGKFEAGPAFSELIVFCGVIGVLGIVCVYVLKTNK